MESVKESGETYDTFANPEIIDSLLQQHNEEISHESCENYFRNILDTIQDIPISNIPINIIYKIATLVTATLSFKSEWKDYVARLGIDTYFELAVIETSADCKMEPPLYIALSGPYMHNGTFGRIVEVLLEKNRLDVLNHIQSPVQDFLEKRNENKYFATPDTKLDLPNSQKSCQTERYNKKAGVQKNITEQLKNVTLIYCTAFSKKHPSWKEKLLEPERVENISLMSVPQYTLQQNKEYSLSVFIAHTESDTVVAQKLAYILSNFDINVTVEHDVEYLMAIDDCGVINAILHKVDFVVPVLSPTYLKCIRPNKNIGRQPQRSTNDRFIFQWLQTELKNNDLMNFRVKPVITEELDDSMIRQELLFKYYWKLWGEALKLVNILKSTKPLLNLSNISFY